MNSSLLSRAALCAAPFITLGPLFAQDLKPARVADVHKGFGEVTTFSDAERITARKPHATGTVAAQAMQAPAGFATTAVYYTQHAGTTWASTASYKASFGVDGFTYVPYLGADAPRNYPVRFALEQVRVAGKSVPFVRDVAPTRDGNRVVFDRGVVREIYDLSGDGIEQTFAVIDAAAGDVEIALRVHSELREDAERAGLQFANELGAVSYGDAFVVDGARKLPIESSFEAGVLRLHVAAAQRPTGTLVIDPVIGTDTVTPAAQNFANPDIAYDASTDRYLLVWQRNFSATDVDVWSEMRNSQGAVVSGSEQFLENGTAHWSKPRVANMNTLNRFLVVAEQLEASNPAGQQYTIVGRTVNAVTPFTMGTSTLLSGPESGDKRDPDVGGDAGPNTPAYWTIAYTRELTATDHDIHARQVNTDGTPRGNTIFIENSGNTIYRDVAIAQNNGQLPTGDRRWLLVYSYKFSATDWDVYGAMLRADGTVANGSTAIDTSAASHRNPAVSSATDELPESPSFGVVYTLDSSINNLRMCVVGSTLQLLVNPTNLSTLLGVSNTAFGCVETDGCRFAVAYAGIVPAYVATLAVVGNGLVVHEAPQLVAATHDAYSPSLAARGANGGPTGSYGLVYRNGNATPHSIVFANYAGHANGGFLVRATGCNGLGINASGAAILGRTANVSLTGNGSDLVGMLIGSPTPAVSLCGSCRLGVDLSGATINLPNVGSLPLEIPCMTNLVGSTVTLQGYAVGSGPCFGVLRLSDSLDVTIQ